MAALNRAKTEQLTCFSAESRNLQRKSDAFSKTASRIIQKAERNTDEKTAYGKLDGDDRLISPESQKTGCRTALPSEERRHDESQPNQPPTEPLPEYFPGEGELPTRACPQRRERGPPPRADDASRHPTVGERFQSSGPGCELGGFRASSIFQWLLPMTPIR